MVATRQRREPRRSAAVLRCGLLGFCDHPFPPGKGLGMSVVSPPARPRPVWRDLYIGAVLATAVSLFAIACNYRSSEPVNIWGALGLFSAMLVAERLSVFVPREAKVSDRKSTRLNSSHVSISYAVF